MTGTVFLWAASVLAAVLAVFFAVDTLQRLGLLRRRP